MSRLTVRRDSCDVGRVATNFRARESRQRRLTGMRDCNDPRMALGALLELRQLGNKPKASSHGHRHNVLHYTERDQVGTEVRFVLMDYEKNEQLKAKMMTRLEAWKRNENLRGTGFAWAMCSK